MLSAVFFSGVQGRTSILAIVTVYPPLFGVTGLCCCEGCVGLLLSAKRRQLAAKDEKTPYVFHGFGENGHLIEPKPRFGPREKPGAVQGRLDIAMPNITICL